ncbi:hypothetical protein GCM10022409_35970 [Hymenobacter glaciei]|uniref:Peptidase S74 domain-containing protein n=1 Tax=Hymenobacter glaciei TaxID=877209 RepID=A0ABP7ULD5_9BACT
MRPLYKLLLGLTGLPLLGGHTALAQQGIGTGSNPPRTTLDVNGPTAAYETTATLSGASPSYQVPAVGQVQLSGTPTGTIGLSTAAAVPGQRLVVYNNTGVPATLNSQLIPAAQAVEFLYSASGWRASAGGSNGVGANNGLSKTGNTVQLGGPLTQPTTLTNNGMPLTIAGAGGSTTFTSGGNVGIGTAGTAAEKLEVNGNIRLGSEPAAAFVGPGSYLEFNGNGVNTDVIGLVRYNNAVGSAASNNSELRLVMGDDVVSSNSSSADRFVLGTTTVSVAGQANFGTFTPRFFVYGNGAVGIGGDASPTHVLNVTGDAQISGRTTCNNGVSIRSTGQPTMSITSTTASIGNVAANSAGNFYYDTAGNENHVFGGNVVPDVDGMFANEAKNLGNSNARWGTVYCYNGTVQTSDSRLKTNIENLAYGLKDVLKMRPVAYNWKAQPTANHMVGFIAQEMEQIVPEAVEAPKAAGEHYGMKYTELIPVLTKAIQEQQVQIEGLKTANAKLTAANAALQTSLDGKASASTLDALQVALQTLRGEMQALQATGTTARGK